MRLAPAALGETGGIVWDQEFPEQIRYSPFGEPDRIIHRGHGSGMLAGAERLAHMPRAHGEALTVAWADLYSEMALSIAAQREDTQFPDDLVEVWGPDDGARGVRFVHLCADSHEAAGPWLEI